jgi:5-methylcytosine-specific restriction protein A
MTYQDVTREAILKAVAEYDRRGPVEFLAWYGFKPARSYFLVHDGKRYDSKAIVGVAHRYLPGWRPLTADSFTGGKATVAPLLQRLGFTVQVDDSTEAKPERRLATPEDIAAIRAMPYDPALRKTKFGDINFRSCVLCGWQYAEPEGTNQRYCDSEWSVTSGLRCGRSW